MGNSESSVVLIDNDHLRVRRYRVSIANGPYPKSALKVEDIKPTGGDEYVLLCPHLSPEAVKAAVSAAATKNVSQEGSQEELLRAIEKFSNEAKLVKEVSNEEVKPEEILAVRTNPIELISERITPFGNITQFPVAAGSAGGIMALILITGTLNIFAVCAFAMPVAAGLIGAVPQFLVNRHRRNGFSRLRRSKLLALKRQNMEKRSLEGVSQVESSSDVHVEVPCYEADEKATRRWSVVRTKTWPSRLHWFDGKVIAKRVLDETNRYRMSVGMRPLVWYDELAQIATAHCTAMRDGKVEVGSQGLQDRIAQYPYKSSKSAENVAKMGFRRFSIRLCGGWEYGVKRVKYDVAKEVVEEWIVSDAHRANLEGGFNAAGVGAVMHSDYTWYVVAMYAKFVPSGVDASHA